MAFSDPQSVTINAVANSLPRVSSGVNTGTFRKDDANVELLISHQYGKRTRRQIKLTHRKVAADPLLSGVNSSYSMSVYLVIDHPVVGYTVAEAKQITDALVLFLTTGTGANVTKMLGGEN